ncbi:MAG: hypothetical protein ACT4OX_15530 [Actinomycetota bacterium]
MHDEPPVAPDRRLVRARFSIFRKLPHHRVDPSVPFYGGPVALDTDDTTVGERVYSYGNSSLCLGAAPLSPKQGVSLGTDAGWSHAVYTLSPGIPGDSGSAFLDGRGDALGVLSTLALAPLPASNGVSDLASMLAYMRAQTNFDAVNLVPGTEAFQPGRLL